MILRKILCTVLVFTLLASTMVGCSLIPLDKILPGGEKVETPDNTDPVGDNTDNNGGNTDNNGGNTDNNGGNTDNNGGNTDGGNTDGGNTDSGNTGGNTDGGNTDNNGGNTDGGNTDGGNTDSGNTDGGKIDLPDDYVITMSDMERFLLTKNEQYPITNEYVELYQQASGGYIDNAKKAGLVVDKSQHLPSQKWHYFESWLYATIEEGMSWDASASDRSYGKFSCPELLLWIIEATGVETEKVIEAKNIAIEGKQNGVGVSTICASIRAAVPFNTYLRPIIIEFLENNPKDYQTYSLTVNTDSAYQLSSVKSEYKERETVTLSIIMTDNTKEIAQVTANGKVLKSSSGTTYKFSMPGENVTVVITLKDKDAPIPPVEATKDYYYDVVYQLPGKQAVQFTDPTQAYNVLQFNGKKDNIITSVSSIENVYGGGRGGSGDNIWYGSNMIKLGTTNVTGSITIELNRNVTGVIITGYVTNNSCNIRVGDSSSTYWSVGTDDGKTTVVTAKDDYFMNVITKDMLEAGATSTIQINFESTNSVTISADSAKYVLYITSIEFIVDGEA